MKVRQQKNSNHWLRRHAYSIAIITCAVLFVVGGLSAYALWAKDYISRTDAASAAAREESYKIAADAIAEKARILQEQEAAARQAAEQSKTGDAANIDATACNRSSAHADPASPDVIVNKKHCIQPLEYAPSDLVTVHGRHLAVRRSTPSSSYTALPPLPDSPSMSRVATDLMRRR